MKHSVPRLTLLLFTFLLLSSSIFAEDKFASKANIGFEATIHDNGILELLQRHSVVPHAAFMWTAGLTGMYRTFEAKSLRAFLQEARAQAIGTFKNGLRGKQLQLQHFVAMHTEEEVVADEDLEVEARSLLNIRATLMAALDAAQKGEPLIFAIEVSSETSRIAHLVQDAMVKVVERGVDGQIKAPQTPKPEAYEEEYFDPEIQAMSAQELYRWMHALAATGEREGK